MGTNTDVKMKAAAALATGAVSISAMVGTAAGFATNNPAEASQATCSGRIMSSSNGQANIISSEMVSFSNGTAVVSMNVAMPSTAGTKATMWTKDYTCQAHIENGSFVIDAMTADENN
jgi:hypothetical protein